MVDNLNEEREIEGLGKEKRGRGWGGGVRFTEAIVELSSISFNRGAWA